MYRKIEQDLVNWKQQHPRKPLLIRGARQVGKSYIIEKFAKAHFTHFININFEIDQAFLSCFHSLNPVRIVQNIEVMLQTKVIVGDTLIFLDEIQLCPKAILALRYFKERMPDLHIIGAGSLLELVIHEEKFQQPVGRVQSLFMKPCSFQEFLLASGDERLIEYLSTVDLKNPVESNIHELLLEKCWQYFILGGMPEVIHSFVKQQDYLACERIQQSIFEYYQRDLIKYKSRLNTRTLAKVFAKAPGLIAQRFRYVDIDPEVPARDQRPILDALFKANIIHPIYHSSANGLPLELGMNEKKFKLLFLDIGLAAQVMQITRKTWIQQQTIIIDKGCLAEQFVGQELLAYSDRYREPKLYYWERDKQSSQAEVDYIIHYDAQLYPLEVKAGKSGRLRSIQVFLNEKGLELGIQVSPNPLSFQNRIISIPFYLIHELPRLISLMHAS